MAMVLVLQNSLVSSLLVVALLEVWMLLLTLRCGCVLLLSLRYRFLIFAPLLSLCVFSWFCVMEICGNCGNLLRRIVGSNGFSAQFVGVVSHYGGIGCGINVLQQTACLVVNPITVGNFAFLFNYTPVGWTSDSMMVPT